jgi:hypothetical protein
LDDVGAAALVQNLTGPAQEVRKRLAILAVASAVVGTSWIRHESLHGTALTSQEMVHSLNVAPMWLGHSSARHDGDPLAAAGHKTTDIVRIAFDFQSLEQEF